MQHSLVEDWLKDKDISPNLHKKFLPKKSSHVAKKSVNGRVSASLKRGSVQRDLVSHDALNRTGNRSHKSPRKSTTKNATDRDKSSSYIENLLEPNGLGDKMLKHLIKKQILREIIPKEMSALMKGSIVNKKYIEGTDANKKGRGKEQVNNKFSIDKTKLSHGGNYHDEGTLAQNKSDGAIAYYLYHNKENIAPAKRENVENPGSKKKNLGTSKNKELNNITFKNINPLEFMEKIPFSEDNQQPPTCRKIKQVSASSLASMFGKIEMSKQILDFNKRTALDKSFLGPPQRAAAEEYPQTKKGKIKLRLDDEPNYSINNFSLEKKVSAACCSNQNSKKVNPRTQSFAHEGTSTTMTSFKPSLKIGNSYLDLELITRKKKVPQEETGLFDKEEENVDDKLKAENNMNIQASKFSRFSRKGYSGFQERDSNNNPAIRSIRCKNGSQKKKSSENRNKSCGNIDYFTNEKSISQLNENIQAFTTISVMDNINNKTSNVSSTSKIKPISNAIRSSPHFYNNQASEILVINDLLDTHHKRKSTPDERSYNRNDSSNSRNKSYKKMGSEKINLSNVPRYSMAGGPLTSEFNSLDSNLEKDYLSKGSGMKIPSLKETVATTAQPSHCKRKQVTRSSGRTTSNPRTHSRKGDQTVLVNVADFGTDSTKLSLCESSYMDCEENLNLCSSFLQFNRDNSRKNLLDEQASRKNAISSNGKFSSQVMSNYKKKSVAHSEEVQNWKEDIQENFRGSRNLRYEHKLNESLEESCCSSLSPECDRTKLGSESRLDFNNSNINYVTVTKFQSSNNKTNHVQNNSSHINIINNNMSEISDTPGGNRTETQEFWFQEDSLYEEESFSKTLEISEKSSFKIDQETYAFLISREPYYSPDPFYLEKKQPFLNWQMRAVLLDWMMEVCTEFGLKRETYHISINILDRYLTSSPPVEKVEFQLIGVTAIYISSKIEEVYPPRLNDFVRSTDNGYSCELIQEMEERIFKVLQWLVNPPTLNLWANWFMLKWDLYVENTNFAKCYLLNMSSEVDNKLLQFKKANEQCYRLFRELFLYLDTATLDIQSFQYKSRPLIAAFLFLILGEKCGQFSKEQIGSEFSKSSLFILNSENVFNSIFSDFIVESFGFSLAELLPTIRYASTFFEMNLFYDLPPVVKRNPENFLQGHFEEFLAYQTYSNVSLNFIQNKRRLEYC